MKSRHLSHSLVVLFSFEKDGIEYQGVRGGIEGAYRIEARGPRAVKFKAVQWCKSLDALRDARRKIVEANESALLPQK